MIWITRTRPVIDRIACPWLVLRFIDPQAQFLFLPTEEVLATAQILGGIAFDIPGGRYEHQGDDCTFNVLMREFDLDGNEALAYLANIIRAADTDRLEDAPEAAGLLALSLGLRQLHDRDAEQLQAGLGFYDALYAWSQTSRGERHLWKR